MQAEKISIENISNPDLFSELNHALCSRYADKENEFLQIKLRDLAEKMVIIVSKNPEKNTKDLLEELQQSTEYEKFSSNTFEEEDLVNYFNDLKEKIQNQKNE